MTTKVSLLGLHLHPRLLQLHFLCNPLHQPLSQCNPLRQHLNQCNPLRQHPNQSNPFNPTPFPTPNPVFVTPNPVTAPPSPAPIVSTPQPTPPPTPQVTPQPTVGQEACPAAPPTGCSVCGDGRCVTLPDVVFTFPGQPSVPCGDLENAGLTGLIPLSQCVALPPIIEGVCGCDDSRPATGAPPTPAPTPLVVSPTPAPTPLATPAPTPPAAASCPDVPANGCSVCGDNLCVTNPDAIFMFVNQPDVACGVLQDAGLNGAVPLDQCPFLPSLIGPLCGCQGLSRSAEEPRLFEHVGSGHFPGE